jgi:hypothetical protein
MSTVEQKKERIRVALQELGDPSSKMSTCEAMGTLHNIFISENVEEFGSLAGDFVGDDDFKEEIFSARVIQAVITVAQDKKVFPPKFYLSACSVLSFLCSDNSELATAFVANGGVQFLLETLEAFSSNQQAFLFKCFVLHKTVFDSLDENESQTFAGMILEKLVDVFELNYETVDEVFYKYYCGAVANSFGPGLDLDVKKKCFPLIVSHAWHGVSKHKHDENSQLIARGLLCLLVGGETAWMMIDNAEMHACAACA